MYMPDNYDAWKKHDDEMEEALKKLPVCKCCGDPIQQEKAVYYNGSWCCEYCEEEFWLSIREDFLESTL